MLKLNEEGGLEWEYKYGGSGDEKVRHSALQTQDGGYILAGWTNSNDGDVGPTNGKKDIWVLKINATGNTIEWSQNYGGSEDDAAHSIVQLTDGSYLIGGWTASSGLGFSIKGEQDCWVIKIDSIGQIIWSKNYGGSGNDKIEAIQETENGGFIFAARSGSTDQDITNSHQGPCNSCGEADIWVVKCDSSGTILWEKSLGSASEEAPWGIIKTSDNGYLAYGNTWGTGGDVSNHYGESDAWLVKLDSIGNIEWEKNYGGSLRDSPRSVVEAEVGGYLFSGMAESNDFDVDSNYGGQDVWVVKVDTSGQIEWEKNFGGSLNDSGTGVAITEDGNYAVLGNSSSNDIDVTINHGAQDLWLLNVAQNGQMEWEKSIGALSNDGGWEIRKTSDSGFLIAGYSDSGHDKLSYDQNFNSIPASQLNDGDLYFGDWDGDGISDMMWFRESDGRNKWYINDGLNNFSEHVDRITPSELANGKLHFGDWNADGLIDVMWHSSSNNGLNKWLTNNGDLTFPITNDPITPGSFDNGQLYFGDWNSDGYTDVMLFGDNQNGDNDWFTNNGNLTFTFENNPIDTTELNDGEGIFFGDWNGDGITDVMWYDSQAGSPEQGSNKWFINDGNLNFTSHFNPIDPSLINEGSSVHLGDWNGDGITDFLWFDADPSSGTHGYNRWFINDGTFNFKLNEKPINPGEITNGQLAFGDWNGDGLTDLLWYFQDSGANKWFINSNNFEFTLVQNPIPQSYIDDGTGLFFGDWNGDGITNPMWFDKNTGENSWFVTDKNKENLLKTITTGHGVETDITYAPLTDSTLYTKQDTATYPDMDFQAAMYVVSSFKTSNGIGGQNETSYHYEGATFDLTGRGFRGFKKTTLTDEASGIRNIIHYERDYKCISSKIKRTEQYAPDSTLNPSCRLIRKNDNFQPFFDHV